MSIARLLMRGRQCTAHAAVVELRVPETPRGTRRARPIRECPSSVREGCSWIHQWISRGRAASTGRNAYRTSPAGFGVTLCHELLAAGWVKRVAGSRTLRVTARAEERFG